MKKFDKEMLQKNRFWIGLGSFVLIWFIAVIVLLCSDDSSAGEKSVKDTKEMVTKISNPKSPKFLPPLEQKYQVLNAQKDRVWEQAWNSQNEMMQWPIPDQGDRDYWINLSKNAPFGEKLKETELTGFLNLYKPLLDADEVKQYIDTSVVQVKPEAIKKDVLSKTPTSEECWYAMEDVTVQRELLGVVRAALDSVGNFDNLAFFHPVDPPEEKTPEPAKPGTPSPVTTPTPPTGPAGTPATGTEEPPKKIVLRRSFRNTRWQLDLVLERDEKKVVTLTTKTKLTNITSDQPSKDDPEVAGLTFQLVQQNAPKDSKPAEFTLAGQGKSLTLEKPVTLSAVTITDPQTTPILYVRVKDESTPKMQVQRMRSANWELELKLETLTIKVKEQVKDADGKIGFREVDKPVWCVSPATKIKNVAYSRRSLPVALAVLAVGNPNKGAYAIAFPSDPLPWMGTTTLKTPMPAPSLEPKPGDPVVVQVHQVFNPLTSPVKSIEDIVINANSQTFDSTSHRTKNRPLMKAAKKFQIEAPKADATATTVGGGVGGGSSTGPPGGMPGSPYGQNPNGPAAAAPGDATPENNLPRNRYVMLTDQVRLMPVAMKLTVDQAYVQDVLTAVVNSRLRIEVTQVQEQRARGVTLTLAGASKPPDGGNPPMGTGEPTAGVKPPRGGSYMGMNMGMGGGSLRPPVGVFPGVGSGGMGGSSMGGSSLGPPKGGMVGGSGGMYGMPGGGFPGGFGGGLPGATASAGDEEDPNLVTIVIYGVATLYERYKAPEKPSAAAGAGNPPVTGAPQPAKP